MSRNVIGARGTVNARDKGALAVYAEVKRELAEDTARRRAARYALAEAIIAAREANVSRVSALELVARLYGEDES